MERKERRAKFNSEVFEPNQLEKPIAGRQWNKSKLWSPTLYLHLYIKVINTEEKELFG